jgi:hypothetical protein
LVPSPRISSNVKFAQFLFLILTPIINIPQNYFSINGNIRFIFSQNYSKRVNISVPSTSSGASTSARDFPTIRGLNVQSDKKFKDSYDFENFKICLEKATKRIELKYREFAQGHEKHPEYSNEWKAFWKIRRNELIAQGKDANGHDYNPDWINYWGPRMKQLKLKEIDIRRGEILEKLNLSNEMAESFEEEIQRKKISSPKLQRSPSPCRTRSRRSRSPIEISDHEIERGRSRTRYSPGRSRKSRSSRSSSPEANNDGLLNIVTVCRLLLALEPELGCIAPRVIALSEQSLSHERAKANSSDELLMDMKNINFLDMIKEKLKGLLAAGMIGESRVVPVKEAIRNIAALMYKGIKLNAVTTSVKTIIQPNPTELAKLKIANVFAKTLLDQGKTGVSAKECAEIVDDFMLKQLYATNESNEMQINDEPHPTSSSSAYKFTPSEPPRLSQHREEPKGDNIGLEKLNDEDLKTLLRNFSDLTEDEQINLILYLKKLEKSNARRVNKLSKYVDAGDDEIDDDESSNDVEINPSGANQLPQIPDIAVDLSDDDYPTDDEYPRLPNIPPRHNLNQGGSGINYSADDLLSNLMLSIRSNQEDPPQVPNWGWDIHTDSYYTENPPSRFDGQVEFAQPIAAMSVMAIPIQYQNPSGMSTTSFSLMEMAFATRQSAPPAGGPTSSLSNKRKVLDIFKCRGK